MTDPDRNDPDPKRPVPERLAPERLAQTALRGALWSALETWGQRGVTTLTFLIIVRFVPKDALGIMALATIYVMLAQCIVEQGFGDALVQAQITDQRMLSALFWRTQVLAAILAGMTLAAAPLAARLYDAPDLEPVLQVLALTPLLHGLSTVPQAVARRDLSFRLLAIRRTLGAVAGGAVAMIMAWRGAEIWALVAQSLIGQALGLAVLWAGCTWRPVWAWRVPGLKPVRQFGGWIMAQALLRILAGQIDRLLIGLVLGPATLGVYSVAQRVLLIVSDLVAGSLERLILPLFAKIKDDPARLRRGVLRANGLIALLVFPAYGGLVAIAPDFVPVLIGPGWDESIPVIQALAGASLLFNLGFFLTPVLTALGKLPVTLCLMLAQGMFNAAMVLSLPDRGLVTLCVGLTVAQFLIYIFSVGAVRKAAQIDGGSFVKPLLVPALLTLVMMAAVMIAQNSLTAIGPAWLRLALLVPMGMGLYAGLLRLGAPQRFAEIGDLLRGLKRSR